MIFFEVFFFKNHQKSLISNFYRNFQFYFVHFPEFLGLENGLYWSYTGFPNIFDTFPHFLGLFPVLRKVLNYQFVDRFPLFLGQKQTPK